MENNYSNHDHGPEVMEWFAKDQARRHFENQQEQIDRKHSGVNVRDRKKNVSISKLDVVVIALSAVYIGRAISGAYDGVQDILQHRRGARYNYENLVQSGNMPENLKIGFFLEGNSYDVSYRTMSGERVKRENVDIQSFVNDICASALDNGATMEEMATGFSYAGLTDGMIGKLLDVTSEQIDQCELESYQQWVQEAENEKSGRSL